MQFRIAFDFKVVITTKFSIVYFFIPTHHSMYIQQIYIQFERP
jgi:hypothetical protein